MTYALVIDNTISDERGRPPVSARRLDTGEWVLDLPNAHWSRQRATGWWQVTDTARPADTATATYDRTVTLVDGTPTVTWVERPWTADELAARTAQANRTTLTGTDRLAARLTRLAAYDADAEVVAALARSNSTAPTTAELNRLLKVMLRREKRLTATLALLVRLADPALLTDITDTTDN